MSFCLSKFISFVLFLSLELLLCESSIPRKISRKVQAEIKLIYRLLKLNSVTRRGRRYVSNFMLTQETCVNWLREVFVIKKLELQKHLVYIFVR